MAAVAEKPVDIFKPASLDDHQADLELRKEERASKRETLQRCIDPDYAKRLEAQKPEYEFKVWCKYAQQTVKGPKWTEAEETVVAQSELNAWAKFCDQIGAWPSPATTERKIVKGKKV